MMISNKKKILIITYDLNLNQTSSARYFSFVKALLSKKDLEVLALGICFPFKSHPINSTQKASIPPILKPYVRTIIPNRLNFIQKLLVYFDNKNIPYFFKKILLALYIIVYQTDQWFADLDDLDFVPDVIISGGSSGIIKTSYKLAKKHGASLILDYRDPWNFGYNLLETNNFIYHFKKKFTKRQELKFLMSADKIITVSDSLKGFFPKNIQGKVFVIENGSNYDSGNFEKEIAVQSIFTITYLGTVYDEQLLDESFFSALSGFIKRENLTKQDIELLFLGSIKNNMLPKIVIKYGLVDYVQITERKEYNELLAYLQSTRLFLHLKYGDRGKIISSKQADYLMFRKPILLPNTDNGDLAESITKNSAGYVRDGKIESIVNVLQLEYDMFLRGESNILNDRDFSSLSRSKIAEKLLEIIP